MNRKAQSLGGLASLAVFAFLFLIILGVTLYYFGILNSLLTDSNLIQDGLNYSNYSQATVGSVNSALLNHGDLIGVCFIFGMVLLMFVTAYFSRDNPTVFFIIDLIILIFAYILAVYMSNTYETILTTVPFGSLIISNLNNSSTIMLHLPLVVIITGAITMIISYAGIPKSQEEEVAGF